MPKREFEALWPFVESRNTDATSIRSTHGTNLCSESCGGTDLFRVGRSRRPPMPATVDNRQEKPPTSLRHCDGIRDAGHSKHASVGVQASGLVRCRTEEPNAASLHSAPQERTSETRNSPPMTRCSFSPFRMLLGSRFP